jgi:hypothetical protein
MMRRSTPKTLPPFVAQGAVLLLAAPAAADDSYDDGRINRDGEVAVVIVDGEERAIGVLEAIASGDGPPYVAVPAHGGSGDPADVNQGYCRTIEWVIVPDGADPEDIRAAATQEYWRYISGSAPYFFENPADVEWDLPCEVDPLDALPPAVIEAAVRAEAFTQLPRPAPVVDPGWGMPGLRMYLDTGEEHALTMPPRDVTVDLGVASVTVTFSAEGVSTVDWGDGTVTTHTEPGGPWPNGAINHVWTDAGAYDVTVTDAWVVSYEVPGRLSGEFAGTLDPVTLSDLPIRERRAVRTR